MPSRSPRLYSALRIVALAAMATLIQVWSLSTPASAQVRADVTFEFLPGPTNFLKMDINDRGQIAVSYSGFGKDVPVLVRYDACWTPEYLTEPGDSARFQEIAINNRGQTAFTTDPIEEGY